MSHLLGPVFEPGFFESAPVHTALIVGAVVAVVAASVGVFTVMRGQSFAGEALGDIGTTGGSGAFLVGVARSGGSSRSALAAAAVMELIGIQRARGRDLATGSCSARASALAALFFYLDTTYHEHDRRDRHDPLRLDFRRGELADACDRRPRGHGACDPDRTPPPAAARLD